LFLSRSITGWRACRFGCNKPAYACGGVGIVEDASAAQNVGTGLCLATEMVLASCVLNIQRQLPGGNRSCTKNGRDYHCKQGGFDSLFLHNNYAPFDV
jgi:hypothetical protein